jgi:N-acetylglucosamine-6-phosphate deacetylase
MTSITAARVFTAAGWTGPARVHLDGERISDVEPIGEDELGDDLPPRLLVPGFVDLQVNGIDAVDVSRAQGADWDQLDASLLAQGVTTWCPTLVTTRLDAYAAPLGRIRSAMHRASGPVRPRLAGVHLEGPFLGGAPGAHRPELIVPIDLDWLADLPDHVRILTLGPEQHAAADAIRLLVDRGVVVSLGHTTADAAQFTAAVDAGATMVTHLFNAMSGLHHRSPGVAASALAEPRVSVSIIADGVHVHPTMVRLALDVLGSRAVLVTDAVGWRAGSAGPVRLELRDGAPRLPDGTLAGSALTMDAALRTCVEHAGVGLHAAVHAASTRPAGVLGLADRGDVRPGLLADLVALDADLHVEQVWVGGHEAI